MDLIVQCSMGNEHTFADVSVYLRPSSGSWPQVGLRPWQLNSRFLRHLGASQACGRAVFFIIGTWFLWISLTDIINCISAPMQHLQGKGCKVAQIHTQDNTVGSRLSESRFSEFSITRTLGRRHVFGSSGKKTFWSLEFCYRKKQVAVWTTFPRCYNAIFRKYGI